MDLLYWKWKKAWEVKYEEMEAKRVGDEPFNVNGDDIFGDLRDWEQFADKNYNPQAMTFGCVAVALLPFLLLH
jgi:hypothetical protein